ncbi:low specificity L-threonine aldolase [Formicincola oecophyllae]|uniref:Low specificity L-threonine aldolase n=1 Tax=Formicincola oecophyllae TaxID=2558361 RepID=A0A4Y6U9R5_9PROT|nr:beta-eliminating lyase-related protein [Formicincola oecophyllae]QDH13177.1 low specificity L-threonine aldolase [Formicincola oecophyllae]
MAAALATKPTPDTLYAEGTVRKDFTSDNVAPVDEAVMAAMVAANQGNATPYGLDPLGSALEEKFRQAFGIDVAVFTATTGTAANALSLASLVQPWGSVVCDGAAHIDNDEGGAPEFFTGGSKIYPLPSHDGRMDPAALKTAMEHNKAKGVLAPPYQALSLTQATEWGTVYTPTQLQALCATAHEGDLAVHLDGARLGNALAHLKTRHPATTLAEATWGAGVDVLVFGGTKAGAMAAEAIVFFLNPQSPAHSQVERAVASMRRQVKRSGHLWSKGRYLSAQLLALLEDGHTAMPRWLANGAHANQMARQLRAGLDKRSTERGLKLPFATESDELFVVMPTQLANKLAEQGFSFYRFPVPPFIQSPQRQGQDDIMVRFVTSFYTRPQDVQALLNAFDGDF